MLVDEVGAVDRRGGIAEEPEHPVEQLPEGHQVAPIVDDDQGGRVGQAHGGRRFQHQPLLVPEAPVPRGRQGVEILRAALELEHQRTRIAGVEQEQIEEGL
jgi:hypothetical protein